MRLFCLSDIHVDFTQNQQWLEALSLFDYQQDALILAGDVSDKPARLSAALKAFSVRFKSVYFVPGNHDLWCRDAGEVNSLTKFEALKKTLAPWVSQTPELIQLSNRRVLLLPCYSWYDFSFAENNDFLKGRWLDFQLCQWPESLPDETAINDYFLQANHASFEHARQLSKQGIDALISFSHFLPRIDVMPDYIPAKFQQIYPVLGSDLLDAQIRQLANDIRGIHHEAELGFSHTHVYGHSHVNRDVEIEGIRYVNNAFAGPSETRIARKRLFQLM